MNYTDNWNKIVDEYKKTSKSKEDLVQRTWEMLFKFCFKYLNSEIDSQRRSFYE